MVNKARPFRARSGVGKLPFSFGTLSRDAVTSVLMTPECRLKQLIPNLDDKDSMGQLFFEIWY